MAPRLKIFQWSDGFHVFTVATGSRPKALAAWGVRQDLFASGLAREVKDSPDAEAATAAPGEVIERRLDIALPDALPQKTALRKKPSAADLQRVAQAKKTLDDLDAAHERSTDEIDAALRALRTRRESEMKAYETARAQALARLDQARLTLKK